MFAPSLNYIKTHSPQIPAKQNKTDELAKTHFLKLEKYFPAGLWLEKETFQALYSWFFNKIGSYKRKIIKDTFLVFNKRTQGDPIVGRGGQHTVKYGLKPKTGDLLVVSSSLYDESAKKELEVYKKTNQHPEFFVQSVDFEKYTNKKRINKLAIVLENMDQGNLRDVLERKDMTAANLWSICKTLIDGIACLHNLGISHRDLKLDNIFCKQDPNTKSIQVKIGDFGSASFSNSKEITGATPHFVSPEGEPSDIWALGIMLYQLITNGKNPPWVTDLCELNKAKKNGVSVEEQIRFLTPRIQKHLSTIDKWFPAGLKDQPLASSSSTSLPLPQKTAPQLPPLPSNSPP